MAFSASDWHILSICLFPVISIIGLTLSIFISSANNRTFLAMGIMFSAGVLVSASLVHMLPHSSEVLDIYFAPEDNHDDHSDESQLMTTTTDDHFAQADMDPDDDHAGHDHVRYLQDDHSSHDDGGEGGDDNHAGHNHAFPWAQTFFSIAFLFLLMIEAFLERFIDVYFSGKQGNFFHINEDEEIMYAEGFAAEHAAKAAKEIADEERLQKEQPAPSQAGTEAERAELVDAVDDKNLVAEEEAAPVLNKAAVELHDYDCTQGHGKECGGHEHDHDHAAADSTTTTNNKTAPPPEAAAAATSTSNKEDMQPVAKPPGPEADIKIPFPDCEDCKMSYKVPIPGCIDCKLLTHEELGYGNADEEIVHRHHHHNNSHAQNTTTTDDDNNNTNKTTAAASSSANDINSTLKKRGSTAKSTKSNDVSDLGSKGAELPPGMFQPAKRRNSGTSNISGKSSVWMKTAGRPSVVSFAVAAPQDEPEAQQTINPWVSILLTLVLSIHVILEGLTLGSSQDVETIKTTFVAVATHKGFAAFSLGSSLVASGYWEGNRNMFFILSGIFVGVDIVSIGIGMGLGQFFDQNGDVVGAVLQSLLGGSFLFVATVELIPGEMEKMRRHSLPLLPILLSLCAGFALMTMLAKWGV